MNMLILILFSSAFVGVGLAEDAGGSLLLEQPAATTLDNNTEAISTDIAFFFLSN
jgi:hypothetical protein